VKHRISSRNGKVIFRCRVRKIHEEDPVVGLQDDYSFPLWEREPRGRTLVSQHLGERSERPVTKEGNDSCAHSLLDLAGLSFYSRLFVCWLTPRKLARSAIEGKDITATAIVDRECTIHRGRPVTVRRCIILLPPEPPLHSTMDQRRVFIRQGPEDQCPLPCQRVRL